MVRAPTSTRKRSHLVLKKFLFNEHKLGFTYSHVHGHLTVVQIESRSRAWQQGLLPGDILVKVNKTRLKKGTNPSAFAELCVTLERPLILTVARRVFSIQQRFVPVHKPQPCEPAGACGACNKKVVFETDIQHPGVSWNANHKKWEATYTCHGSIKVRLGLFRSKKEAILARREIDSASPERVL